MYQPMYLFKKAACWIVFGVALIAPTSVFAGFVLPTGQEFTANVTQSGTQYAAEAYFVLGNGTITLYVANLESSTSSQGQAISGISFSVTPPDANLTVTGVAGNVTSVSNGTFGSSTYQTFTATPVSQGKGAPSVETAANWAATSTNNVTDLGSGAPSYLIVGPTAQYNGNGGDKFNPYFQSTATSAFTAGDTVSQGFAVQFNLTATNIDAKSIISDVVFNFGTSPNEATANGIPVPVINAVATPAPPSVVLLGLGGLVSGILLLRSRRLIAA